MSSAAAFAQWGVYASYPLREKGRRMFEKIFQYFIACEGDLAKADTSQHLTVLKGLPSAGRSLRSISPLDAAMASGLASLLQISNRVIEAIRREQLCTDVRGISR